jgi:DNA-binding PadR family transcriptional regulator
MSRNGSLGEFEHLVLLAAFRYPDGAYGLTLGQDLETLAKRRVSRGALYTTLDRLEQKGFLRWRIEEGGPERGGHPRRRFAVTALGQRALRSYRRAVDNLTSGLEELP